MKSIIKILIIFLLVFLFLGQYISFFKPYHDLLIIKSKILWADFLTSVTLYRDAEKIYREVLEVTPENNLSLKTELIKKILKVEDALQKIDAFYEKGLDLNNPRK